MKALDCLRPASRDEALAMMRAAEAAPEEQHLWLAGGQSLVAAMKLGMATPSVLIDLQDVPGLRVIRVEPAANGRDTLWIGAMATHASVAESAVVQAFAPGLAELAGGIADPQVRQMGTIGGSLAHNDPAACWPCGVLAAGATVVTARREIAADDYFLGLYTTALEPGELILGVRFPALADFCYTKFEQAASRFALTGVAVARTAPGAPDAVRVAVTGLGHGVQRWAPVEQALAVNFNPAALPSGASSGLDALGDLHASADYRRHLAWVLARRCVLSLSGAAAPAHAPLAPRAATAARAETAATAPAAPREGFGGEQRLNAPPEKVWEAILDPRHLQASIPGCESLTQRSAEDYAATVKVGLGPLSVRFQSEVSLRNLQPPHSLNLVFDGQAGALGAGRGDASVRLEPTDDGATVLHWWVQVNLSGRLAQFGSRLVEASARKLSEEFFERFARAIGATPPQPASTAPSGPWAWLRAAFARIMSLFKH